MDNWRELHADGRNGIVIVICLNYTTSAQASTSVLRPLRAAHRCRRAGRSRSPASAARYSAPLKHHTRSHVRTYELCTKRNGCTVSGSRRTFTDTCGYLGFLRSVDLGFLASADGIPPTAGRVCWALAVVSQPRLENERYGELSCTCGCPASYPHDTRDTRMC